VHYDVSGAEANFAPWVQFLEQQELTEATVAEYYEVLLPSYNSDPELMKFERCRVMMELLRDFVATDAIKLPDNVSVEEFAFTIKGRSLVLTRTPPQTSAGWAVGSEVVTNSTAKYLHDTLELGGRGMHTLFSQLHNVVFALINK
jgi:hypothetical protein